MTREEDQKVRVRVWFGRHLIATYAAGPAAAHDYSESIATRFAGLLVTIDDELAGNERPMPGERLWSLPPS